MEIKGTRRYYCSGMKLRKIQGSETTILCHREEEIITSYQLYKFVQCLGPNQLHCLVLLPWPVRCPGQALDNGPAGPGRSCNALGLYFHILKTIFKQQRILTLPLIALKG